MNYDSGYVDTFEKYVTVINELASMKPSFVEYGRPERSNFDDQFSTFEREVCVALDAVGLHTLRWRDAEIFADRYSNTDEYHIHDVVKALLIERSKQAHEDAKRSRDDWKIRGYPFHRRALVI